MQQAPNHLLSWLDHLRILMPPRHVTLVGAGNGSGPWVQWLLSRAVPSATLVEADDALIHPLQATVAAASGAWRVRKQVIGPETATVTFHVASVSSESGLLEPESLRSLWPNLKTRQKQTRQAITLDELLQDDEQSANWLIVDCWPAQPLLQGGLQALSQMDVLIVRTTMGADTPDTLNPAEVESALTEAGFRQIAADAGRHPGVGHALYVRELDAHPQTKAALVHWQQEAERLAARELKLAEQAARLEALLTEAQISRDRHAARAMELEASNTQAKQALLQNAQQIQSLMAREQALGQETTRLTGALDLAQKQLALKEQGHEKAMSTLQATCSTIEKELGNQQARLTKALAAEINQQLQQQATVITTKQQESSKESESRSRTHIEKTLANAVKQLEAFQAIQSFLATGETISNFHGWPISPDLGVFLLEKIQSTEYDLIIEFGSGTSTVLMAKAIEKSEFRAQKYSNAPNERATCRMITFEHSLEYLSSTSSALAANHTLNRVELSYTPLTSWTDGANQYLYYDCTAALKRAKDSINKKVAKILVLVDGPPGNINKYARMPALHFLLDTLGSHQIDIVLDDANRPDEQEIAIKWKEICKARGVLFSEKQIPTEKGTWNLVLNP